MRFLPDAEFDKLKATHADSMQDLCHIQRTSMVSGTYGNSVETLTYAHSGTFCSFQFVNGTIRQAGQILLVDYDVTMRIPSTVTVGLRDEVTLVEKGNTMVSGTFRPSELPMVNEMVQYVKLKRVTT
jgi:hypothetical protein